MRIILSNSSAEPIYEQILRQIRQQIMTGELTADESLPSIRKLALDLRISVITTKRAYDELEREGFICTIPGKGSFVAEQREDILLEQKIRLVEEYMEKTVRQAVMLGVSQEQLIEMIRTLYGDH